jgi:peptidylprolyl isomerase
MRIVSRILVLALAFLAVTACVSRVGPAGAPPVSTPPSVSPIAGECDTADIDVTGAPGAEPVVTLPTGCAPPSRLLTRDLIVGDGREARVGADIVVGYVMVTWSDGKELDSSWSGGENLPFAVENLGRANVISGWNDGLPGIREGGRRLVVVPPEHAYGEAGSGEVDGADTLVFVVDALTVRR